MLQPRLAYFVMETKRDEEGWIPCIAKEGESGFYPTDWRWDCTFEKAQEFVDNMNEKLGLTKKDAMLIQMSTMRKNAEEA